MGAVDERISLPNDIPDPVTFERPPVAETVIGVQFKPLSGLKNAHLGAYWKSLGANWPEVNDANPIEQQFERFEDKDSWAGLGLHFKITQDPSARIMIRHRDGDRMIQVQNGRFHYNWLRKAGQQYPRYRTIRPEFHQKFEGFVENLKQQGIGALSLNQWEVTYVNHIPRGELWSVPSDWPNVIRSLSIPQVDGAKVNLESLTGEWHFEIPPAQGRLHVSLKHARGQDTQQLVLTLTARGPIPDSGGIGSGIDLGRTTIVNTFKAFTTKRAHDYWGLKNEI